MARLDTRQRTIALVAAAVVVGAGLWATQGAAARAPAECFEDPDVDVGIVLDRSGSMTGDRIDTAKSGAQNLVDRLDAGDLSGLVSYSSSARLDQTLTSNHTATSDAIADLTVGGSTATGDAIELSHDDLQASAREDIFDAMVVLTDGKTNTGADPVTQAQQAKDDGIKVFAIGIGDGINEEDLREIASEPEERYFHQANDSSEVEAVFDNVTEELTKRNDTIAPSIDVNLPREGHLYVDGVDQGPGTSILEDRATLLGDLSFQAAASDNCYLDHATLSVSDAGFSYTENATSIATDPFPASALEPGNYTLDAEAVDWVGLNATDRLGLHVLQPQAQSRSIGLWAGAATPENPEYRSQGIHLTDEGTADHTTATVTDETTGVHAEGVHEAGEVTFEVTQVHTSGHARISEVSLFDGMVVAENLVHRANTSMDIIERDGEVTNEVRQIGNLEVAGETIGVDDQTGPIEVDLPGDGFVRFFERDVTHTAEGLEYRSALVHAHAPDAYGGGEVILGDVFLDTGDEGPTQQSRAIQQQDDADSGRDASTGDPVDLQPGLYDGTFAPSDLLDVYTLDAGHGDKIKVNIEPSKRAVVTGGSATVENGQSSTTQPGVSAGLPPTSIRLYDPGGDLRAESLLSGSGAAQSIELNADVEGNWTVEIEREAGFDEPERFDEERYSFYSFDLTVTPVPLLPQNDALSGSDAPPTCEQDSLEPPTIQDGQWAGVLRDDDFSDVYRFEATIGDLVTATLKPGETTDGVAMDFFLLDEQCRILDSSSMGGTYTLKGAPEATLDLPAKYTGTYYLAIDRINGVGNHHVTLSVRDPMPGLPTNDAGSGEDADDDPDNPTQAPPAAFQGTLTDGDTGDAFALSMDAGDDAFVALEMSALSQADATLYTPDGDRIYATQSLLDGTYVWSFTPQQTGDYVLVVEPSLGGGDYTVAWGQVPGSSLIPAVQSSGLSPASMAS
jgi:uncharacterized protein YegL